MLINFGFDIEDLKNLERLSAPEILGGLPSEKKYLRFNFKPDVITYVKTWALLLEDELLKDVNLPDCMECFEFSKRPLLSEKEP